MNKYIILFLLIFTASATAGKDVLESKIDYIYQLDSDSTVFEFKSTIKNQCGSNLYRVKSPNEAVANRKFSLVLAAFTTDKNLAFHDTESCEGLRSIVAWVRITK
ncbi:hypothetical protein [Vibrio harveyi]|uniref:hypothetical protein n=1 Tax=Vibrio harveyi TaxID=669 RepID=UPI0040676239